MTEGSHRVTEPDPTRTVRPPWAVALLLASASFLVLFDSLSVATALPAIGNAFELRPGVLQWVVSLYSLSVGALLVLAGRVCDLYGRRRVLIASLAVCTGGGLVAGVATEPTRRSLIAAPLRPCSSP